MAKKNEKTKKDVGRGALKGHWLWGLLVLSILLLIDLITKVGAQVYFDVMGCLPIRKTLVWRSAWVLMRPCLQSLRW